MQNSEITPVTITDQDNHLSRNEITEITQVENKLEKFSTEISEIFKSKEFAYAVLTTMYANTCHNDQNKFQNDEAIKILERFARQSPDRDLSENILELSKFARNNKQLDRNFSLVSDVIRIVAGSIVLTTSIFEYTSKTDDGETRRLNSLAEILQIISFVTQVVASPITSNNGYKASFTGHFTDEMADAFNRVSTLLKDKIYQSINMPEHKCSNPNHNHSLTTVNGANLCEHGHAHITHAGSKQRHFGTFLNVSSMAISASRYFSELRHLTGSNPVFNNLSSSILFISAPFLSTIGKFSSLRAAKIREKEVLQKISTAKKNMSEDFCIIFEKVSEASLTSLITVDDAVKALKLELVAIGNEMEKEAEQKRRASGIKMSAKIYLNYIKDSIYGLPYETIKKFLPFVPSFCNDSSVPANLQDLELQNNRIVNLGKLDDLRDEIKPDDSASINGNALKDLFLAMPNSRPPRKSRKINTKRSLEDLTTISSSQLEPANTFSTSKFDPATTFSTRSQPSTMMPFRSLIH